LRWGGRNELPSNSHNARAVVFSRHSERSEEPLYFFCCATIFTASDHLWQSTHKGTGVLAFAFRRERRASALRNARQQIGL
jgi:hypothetical protein